MTSGGAVRRAFWTYLVTGVAVFMVSMDNLVVTNALPVIRRQLNTGLEGLEWTVNAYTLTFAVFLLTGAALGDRYGRRRLLAIGLTIFTGASAWAAASPGINSLVAARAVQGLGGAIVMPLTLTLLASVVAPERRGMAFGIWGAMSGLGVALGPVIGGGITEYASWQWIFWINVPIGVLLLPIVALVRESRGGAGRLDPLGVLLATGGLFGLTFGLVRGNGHGWTSGQVLTALVGGGVLLLAFVAWQARARTPMVPLGLFRDRGFALINTISLVMAFGMFGSVFLGAQFLQTVQGYTPFQAGLRTLPWTAMPILAAPVSGLLSDRFGARRIVALAVALQAAGVGWLAVVSSPTVPYARLIPPFVLAGLGMGLFFAPVARLTLGFAPRPLEGVASGTSNALRQFGTVLGVAVLGSVFSSFGGFASGQDFVNGMMAAEMGGAIALGLAAILALALPAPRTAATPEVIEVTPELTPIAG
ncbi:MAG: MFS transporter [Actinobacteria bacterium 13_2_20CM_2_71_6]|nr:MAG: MFS transporter [Actinobacteria bacterium 13_2_20CM_2_71_6]